MIFISSWVPLNSFRASFITLCASSLRPNFEYISTSCRHIKDRSGLFALEDSKPNLKPLLSPSVFLWEVSSSCRMSMALSYLPPEACIRALANLYCVLSRIWKLWETACSSSW